ncbi:MAG: MarR family transcriptional regulator [Chloroflexi bacterium]|nr:MAG: MarR family transcriptional regulator [Chloroflexota bacterium]
MATNEELMYVEKVGLHFEQLTLPRMAGRIFGWLLISESPLVSMSELVDVLQASKSSISSMTRLLIQIGLIELVSLPGERRDYYRIASNAWANSLKDRLAQAHTFRQLAEEGLALLIGSDPERLQRLEEMHSLYAFLEAELPKLLERWQFERKGMEL